jgi:hypothetical protein
VAAARRRNTEELKMHAVPMIMAGAVALCAPCGSARATGASPDVPTTATPVLKFLGSMGVVTKTDQGYNYQNYIPALRYLGVRAVRDGISQVQNLITVHRQTGVMADILDGADLPDLLDAGRTLAAAGALLSFEGPNEPNTWPITFHGQVGGGTGDWTPVAQYQRALYAEVKKDPVLNAYPVFQVSEGGAEVNNVGLQWLTIPTGSGATMPAGTQYADYANAHNYVSGNCHVYIDNVARQAAEPKLNGCWDGAFGEYHLTWLKHYDGPALDDLRAMPKVTTETGWDSVADPGGEDVQGKVLSNAYLDQYAEGWSYTFIYELGDGEGGGGNQGLFHTNWTPKLAATYIHNLTTILADPGPSITPGALDYSIPDKPDTVHRMLMQKSNGDFELAVWGEQVTGSNNVVIELANPASRVRVYDVTVGSTPVQTLTKVKSVALTLSDHALVVEVTP